MAFFNEALPGIYRPRAQWDSEMVSIPNLVHDNLGGRLRYGALIYIRAGTADMADSHAAVCVSTSCWGCH